MKIRKPLTMALLITAAAAAQAQGTSAPMSLEQVRADFLKARASGQLPATGEVGEIHRQSTTVSQVTRAQVENELRVRGPIVTAEGADAGSQWSGPSVRNRSDVQAEAAIALRSGKRIGGKV